MRKRLKKKKAKKLHNRVIGINATLKIWNNKTSQWDNVALYK